MFDNAYKKFHTFMYNGLPKNISSILKEVERLALAPLSHLCLTVYSAHHISVFH
jgi:hypothetical protein